MDHLEATRFDLLVGWFQTLPADWHVKRLFEERLVVISAADNDEIGAKLLDLDEKWGSKYPVPLLSWHNNWENLSTFFKYDAHIRKGIYTTNLVEGFHR